MGAYGPNHLKTVHLKSGHVFRFQMVFEKIVAICLDFRYHLKLGPFANQLFLTIINWDKSRIQIPSAFIFLGSSRIHHPEQPERQSSDPDSDSSLDDH